MTQPYSDAIKVWNPIATIPKDGTPVLVCNSGMGHPEIAWHEETESTIKTYEYWTPLPLPPPPAPPVKDECEQAYCNEYDCHGDKDLLSYQIWKKAWNAARKGQWK